MLMQHKSISHRRILSLNPREPSPDSLTGVVGSLLGSLLGGSSGSSSSSGNSGGSSSSALATPTATASSGSSGGSSSGGGSSGGSENGNGSNGGNGNGNGNGSGGKGKSGSSVGSGGSSSGSSSAIESGTSAMPPANAGEGPAPPNPSVLNGDSVPSSSLSGSAASAMVTLPASHEGSAPGNSSSTQFTSGGPPPSNVGEPPSVGSSLPSSDSSYGSSSSGTGATGIGGLESTATPTFGTGAGRTQNALSSGAVAGIVIASLFFLLMLALVLVRRRAVAHRAQRFKWWLANNANSHSFSFVGVSSHSSDDSTGRSAGNRASARSSFATNFDHGLLYRLASPTTQLDIPELPPMAEVRDRNRVLISTGGEAARRESFASMTSNGSNGSGQYLITATDHSGDAGALSPMSVRPFTPSETFSFPKPPLPSSSTAISARQGVGSPSASTATLVQLSLPPLVFHRELASPPSPISNTAAGLPSVPVIVVNPFEDPVPAFSDTETIRRPFTPNMEDELLVSLGDVVRIFQVFDDGWALVERISVNAVVAGNPHSQQRRGLIPVDCFRETGQELPHFLAQKRLSDYATPHGIQAAF